MVVAGRRSVRLETIYDHLGLPKEVFNQQTARFRDDAAWFHAHIAALRKKYAGRYVVIANREVLAEAREMEALLQKLHEAKADPRLTFVGFVTPLPLDVI